MLQTQAHWSHNFLISVSFPGALLALEATDARLSEPPQIEEQAIESCLCAQCSLTVGDGEDLWQIIFKNLRMCTT